jgi:hypothetical protein
LGVASTIDAHVGRIKHRRQGLSAGEVVLAMAETMLAGGDFMIDLDHQRRDDAGRRLRAVPEVPASTTFAALAGRFDDVAVGDLETAVGMLTRRWFAALDDEHRSALIEARPTIDLDATEIECYGPKKEGLAWNHAGQWAGRAHPATWAEAGVVLAACLGSGADDPRPQAPELIARAVAALPAGLDRPVVRADAGYFDGAVARAALAAGADYAIAAKRNTAVWRSIAAIAVDAWVPAVGMRGAEVAECDYLPAGWPPATRAVVRRVRLSASEIRSARSRRRRTVHPDQLRLALAGGTNVVYAYSLILTNLAGDVVTIEAWFRQRAQIEERLKDSKLGMALRHLPSGKKSVNRVWMWSALLALNLSAWTQSLARADRVGRSHAKRLRRELIVIAARVITHSRRTVLRLSPADHLGPFPAAWATLRALPTAGSG